MLAEDWWNDAGDCCRRSVVMTAGAVHVAVLEFVARFAHVCDLHREVEVLACKRVIPVHAYRLVRDVRHDHDLRAAVRLGLETHANTQVGIVRERAARDASREGRIDVTVAVPGRDAYIEFVACDAACEFRLEAN